MKKQVAIALLSLSLVSCGSTRYYQSTNTEYARVHTRNVLYGPTPPADAVQIGVIVCRAGKQHKAIDRARGIASKHGANFLSTTEAKDISAGAHVANALLGTNIKGKYVFTAYRSEKEIVRR
jgi:hypothetical protein